MDEQTDGVLFHSENFQALSLMQARYREQRRSASTSIHRTTPRRATIRLQEHLPALVVAVAY